MIDEIRLWFKYKKVRKAVAEEQKQNPEWNPIISAQKAGLALLTFLAGALLAMPDTVVQRVIGDAFPPEVAVPLGSFIILVLRFLQNKHKVEKSGSGGAPPPLSGFMLLLLLPGLAQAQTPIKTTELIPGPTTATFETGSVGVFARGVREDYAFGRLTVLAPLPKQWAAWGRLDATATQDGGGLDIRSPELFRSLEVAVGLGRQVGPVRISGLWGVTWSIEGQEGAPVDARLHTAALVVQTTLRGGYVYAGGGHHGPSGGPAVLAGASIPVKGAGSAFVDFSLPTTATALQQKAYVIKIGAVVTVFKEEL